MYFVYVQYFVPKLETLFQLQFLAGMAEKIVQGIEAAESDLSKEKEKKSQEEVGGSVIHDTNH